MSAEAARGAADAPVGTGGAGRAKILLAEDDRFLRKAARAALERQGWEVLVATNGEEAVEAARQGVQLVLLDLILPKLDGFGVLTRLKQDPATAPVPVIMLTNVGQMSEIHRAHQHGAAGYMIKGEMDLSELVARVESVLGK